MTFAIASKIRVLLIGRIFLWFISSVAFLIGQMQLYEKVQPLKTVFQTGVGRIERQNLSAFEFP